MTTINRLTVTDDLNIDDKVAVWDTSNSDTRGATLSTLLRFFQDNYSVTQYEAPSASGFIISLDEPTEQSTLVVITPDDGYAVGNLVLPASPDRFDGQTVGVICTEPVTDFNITSTGATIVGAPATLGVYSSFTLRYSHQDSTWYTLDTTGIGQGSASITRNDFTGNGSTTVYTLTTEPETVNNTQVYIDGVYQEKSTYGVSGTTLTFTEAPPLNSSIEVLVIAAGAILPSAYSGQVVTATAGQTVFTTSTTYTPGANSVLVFVNGLRMLPGSDYIETDANTVTFNTGLTAGDEVAFLIGRVINETIGAEQVGYQPAGTGAVPTDVQTKLRETVSASDFGAVADNSTNNTAAVQSAIDSISEYGGTVYIPEGCNFTLSNITLPARINLDYRIDDDKSSVGQLSELGAGERVLFSSNSNYPASPTGGAVNERRFTAPLHPGYVVDVRKDLSSASTYFGPGQALTPARASFNIHDEQSGKFSVLYVNHETYSNFSGVSLQAKRQEIVLNGVGSGDWATLPAVNELITGATSGAKGHFVSADASSTTINWYSGKFVAGEALTDSNETTSATVSSISVSSKNFNPISQNLTNGAWSVGLPAGIPTHTWSIGGKSAVTKSRLFGQDQIETVTNPSRVWIDDYEAGSPTGMEIVYDVGVSSANRRLTTRTLDSSSNRGMVGAVSATTGFTNALIKATSSYNVASVTRTTTGDYTITFDTPMARADYQVALTTHQPLDYAYVYVKTTSALRIRVVTTGTSTLRDLTGVVNVICTCGDI